MKRNKSKFKKLCGKARNYKLSFWAAGLLMLLSAFVAGALGYGQTAAGICMVGLAVGFTFFPECEDTGEVACDPCAVAEKGRVSGIGLSLLPLTDMSSQAEWVAAVAAGTAILIPAVNGEFSSAATKGPGYGRQDEKNVGFKHTLKFDWDKVANNVDVMNKLNYQSRRYVYWVTDSLIYYSGAVVNFSASYKIDKAIDSDVMFNVEVTWNYKNLPAISTKPADIFDQCLDFSDVEVLGNGFGFSALPLLANSVGGSVVGVSAGVFDLTFPLGITNSSVPQSQATFNFTALTAPAGFTLQSVSVPNTGVGAIAGTATVRVDTAVATNWRTVLPSQVQLTIDAGVGGTQTFELPYSPCDIGLVLFGAMFTATPPGGLFTYPTGTGGNTSGLVSTNRSCYEPSARTIEFGAQHTLPGSEVVTVVIDNLGNTLTVSGVAQFIPVGRETFILDVEDGGALADTYIVHLVISETGTDADGNPVNTSADIFKPVVIS